MCLSISVVHVKETERDRAGGSRSEQRAYRWRKEPHAVAVLHNYPPKMGDQIEENRDRKDSRERERECEEENKKEEEM